MGLILTFPTYQVKYMFDTAPVNKSKIDTISGFSVNLWAISFIKNATIQVTNVDIIIKTHV